MSEKYPCIICGNKIDFDDLKMLEVRERHYNSLEETLEAKPVSLFAFLCPTCTKKAISEITNAVYGLKRKGKTND